LVELTTTFFQAGNSYGRCIRHQLVGLGVAISAIVVGWELFGLIGIAIGAAIGAGTTALLLGWETVRRWPGVFRSSGPIAVWAIPLAGGLFVLRRYELAWLALAVVTLAIPAYRALLQVSTAKHRAAGRHRLRPAGWAGGPVE
jgi:hypothetical protein